MMEQETIRLVKSAQESAEKVRIEGDSSEKARCLDILNQLKKLEMTKEVLASTQAGRKVRALVKHSDPDIAVKAKDVVMDWKSMVQRSNSKSGLSQLESAGTTPVKSELPSREQKEEVEKSVAMTGDTIRDKVRKNLFDSLVKARGEGVTEGDEAVLACQIETAMYAALDGVSAKYKAKFRQLHFNLKDSNNPDLRRKVLMGEFSPSELITASPEELASDAKKEENQRIRDKKLFDSAPSSVKRATTDQFQCGKCRQRKCTYYQMQTRSADEPMTTFVQCTVCNNAWKFC